MKLLFAEDDATTRLIVSNHLRNWGYDVVEASSGSEAWDILSEKDPPPIAILDWMMPGIDGIEICRRLSKAENIRVFIILLTSRNDREDLLHALDSGAHEFLAKPVDIHELRSRIAAARRLIEADLRLRRAESRYREIFHHAPIGIFEAGLNARITTLNPEFASMLGCENTAEALHRLQDSDTQLFYESSRRVDFLRLIGRSGEVKLFEFRVERKDGTLRWFTLNARRHEDPAAGTTSIYAFVEDITERKDLLLRMRHLNQQRRAILESNPIAIAFTVKDLFEWANPAFARLFATSTGKIHGKPLSTLFPDTSSGQETIKNAIAQITENGRCEFEADLQRQDGLHLVARVIGAPLDKEDIQLGCIWMIEDIAERRRQEMDLHRARSRAQHSVDALDYILRHTTDSMSRDIAEIHEISAHLQSLSDSFQPAILDNLERVRVLAWNLAQEINDLSLVAALDDASIQPRFEPHSLLPLLDRVLALHVEASQDKSLKINVNNENATVEFPFDQRLVQRALSILAENAITRSPLEASVNIRLRTYRARTLIEFIDEGKHLEAEIHSPVPGATSHPFTRHNPQLGLRVVENVAKVHGGECGVDDILTGGASFSIALPLQPTTPAEKIH